MFSRNKKTALVTGASSWMGKAIAKRLVEDGYQVYAAARHVERMDDLAQLGARPVRMDISSEAEVATAIDTILAYARLTQRVAKSIRNAYTPGRGTGPERDRPDRVEGRAREETSDSLRGWRLRPPDDADAEMDGRSGARSGDLSQMRWRIRTNAA